VRADSKLEEKRKAENKKRSAEARKRNNNQRKRGPGEGGVALPSSADCWGGGFALAGEGDF
jgi:hypothetical protein